MSSRTQSQRNLFRTAALALFSGIGVFSTQASAQIVGLPTTTVPNGPTLQDAIALGSTGFIIGDKQFFNFSYLGSQTNPANPAPTAGQIFITTAPSSNFGLTFGSADWLSTDGANMDSLIRYAVRVVPSSKQLISGVDLSFNGDAVTPGAFTDASVTEHVSALSAAGLADGSKPSFDIGVVDYGEGNPDNRLNDNLALPTPLNGIYVTKDIVLHSAPRASGGGTVTISAVNNDYPQTVPEPASIGLIGLAGIGLLRRRRQA